MRAASCSYASVRTDEGSSAATSSRKPPPVAGSSSGSRYKSPPSSATPSRSAIVLAYSPLVSRRPGAGPPDAALAESESPGGRGALRPQPNRSWASTQVAPSRNRRWPRTRRSPILRLPVSGRRSFRRRSPISAPVSIRPPAYYRGTPFAGPERMRNPYRLSTFANSSIFVLVVAGAIPLSGCATVNSGDYGVALDDTGHPRSPRRSPRALKN